MSRRVLLLSAALLVATPSFAAAGDLLSGKSETAAGTVVLAGLDLSTPGGVAEAHKRLTIMSERLCRKFRDDRKADDWEVFLDCVHDTLASALERIRSPTSSVEGGKSLSSTKLNTYF
jgi:UrcA family protein